MSDNRGVKTLIVPQVGVTQFLMDFLIGKNVEDLPPDTVILSADPVSGGGRFVLASESWPEGTEEIVTP